VRRRLGCTALISLGCLGVIYYAAAGIPPPSLPRPSFSYYQFFSGALAIVLMVVWVVLVLRYRIWGVAVVFGLSFGLPAVGFAVYAIAPGPSPADAAVVFLVVLLYAAVLLLLALRFTVGRRRRPNPLIYEEAGETGRFMRALAGRAFLVVWLSALLFLVEPGIAVANLAVNAAWLALWIPRRMRTRLERNSVQVSVAPERAFEFVTNLHNWPLYRDDTELVRVTPDGPLASGSEYVARALIPKSLQTTSHRQVESRYHVTAVVPGSSYTVQLLDQQAISRTEFVPVDSGTRIANTRSMVIPYPQASMGVMLNLPRALSIAREADTRRLARLKEILEGAPSQ
jgi:hypothetical protein